MAEKRESVFNAVTDDVRAEVRALMATTRQAALAWADPADGHPMATRVGLATLSDGTPLLFLSGLAGHSAALEKDPRCGLLVGDPGKGDPLAHPRLSLKCRAELLADAEIAGARERYLAAHPKAKLYIGLGDFRFWRLDILGGSFNGGFGRAYLVTPEDLLA